MPSTTSLASQRVRRSPCPLTKIYLGWANTTACTAIGTLRMWRSGMNISRRSVTRSASVERTFNFNPLFLMQFKANDGPAPHTQLDADLAAGMGLPDNGPKLMSI
ncbi:hypothetical protein CK203_090602 [Vitis vinifera]|uniref:Uncharacterized protein n=1 Tax=Vitis vinifera TaxID=29760 RepID=A0A438DKE3_VITVI|nr:hypothetical protein CK203_090602 [Vitis vinifera]